MKHKLLFLSIVLICMLGIMGCGNDEENNSERIEVTENTQQEDTGNVKVVIRKNGSELIDTNVTDEDTTVADSFDHSSRPKLNFSTTDINGNTVSLSDYSSAKLIMVNMWEPWCGPCVNEMPELEQLYESYKDKGLVIIGSFSTTGEDDVVKDIMKKCNTTYPIVHYASEMEPYTTDYVPTTFFMDGDGCVLTDESIVGSNDYNGWAQIVEHFLAR